MYLVTLSQYPPLMQASLSPLSMSRYLGLSGNHGSVRSWMRPGMALLARRYCQHGSLPKISLWINYQSVTIRHLWNLRHTFFFISYCPYLSPTTCPNITPNAAKTADDSELAPRRCFGALSPKYIGCTFMLIPAKQTVAFCEDDVFSTRAQTYTVHLLT